MATSKKKGVPGTEGKLNKQVTIDSSSEQILLWNKEGLVLLWDPQSFNPLGMDVVGQLSEENAEAYFKAKAKNKELAIKAEQTLITSSIESPLVGHAGYRLRIRPRKGYHSVWKSPGEDFDTAMQGPYKQVRNPTTQQEADGYEPGEENGEVKKLLDGEGKVELIALECREVDFQAHLMAMARKSGNMIKGVKEDFFRATEEINRSAGGRDYRITPIDETQDLQA